MPDLTVTNLGHPCFHTCCGRPGSFASCKGTHGSLTEFCQSGFCGTGICCQLNVHAGGPCDGTVGCDGHKCCTPPPQPRPPPLPPPPPPVPPLPRPPPLPISPPPPPPHPRAPAVSRCAPSCSGKVDQCRYGDCHACNLCRGMPGYEFSHPCLNDPKSASWQFCAGWCKVRKLSRFCSSNLHIIGVHAAFEPDACNAWPIAFRPSSTKIRHLLTGSVRPSL